MSKVWFTSDTHFSSERTLNLSKRPFNNIFEMDSTLINNWNTKVNKDDIIYHLGDFGNYDVVKSLNGRIILVLGNHEVTDIKEKYNNDFNKFKIMLMNKGFKNVIQHSMIYDNNTSLIDINLTHIPEDCNTSKFNLFGHIHDQQKVKRFGLNVGMDCHHFFPIDEETVLFYKNAIENFYDNNTFMENCKNKVRGEKMLFLDEMYSSNTPKESLAGVPFANGEDPFLDEDETLSEGTEKKEKDDGEKISMFKKSLNLLYGVSDDEFIEENYAPKIGKALMRGLIIGGVVCTNLVCGAILYFTNKFMKKQFNNKKREQLLHQYEDKLEWVEGKIDRGEISDKERYNLIKVRSQLKRSIDKLSITHSSLN